MASTSATLETPVPIEVTLFSVRSECHVPVIVRESTSAVLSRRSFFHGSKVEFLVNDSVVTKSNWLTSVLRYKDAEVFHTSIKGKELRDMTEEETLTHLRESDRTTPIGRGSVWKMLKSTRKDDYRINFDEGAGGEREGVISALSIAVRDLVETLLRDDPRAEMLL